MREVGLIRCIFQAHIISEYYFPKYYKLPEVTLNYLGRTLKIKIVDEYENRILKIKIFVYVYMLF